MIRELTEGDYDMSIEASDWRFSAVICGMKKYFTYYDSSKYEINKDCLLFNTNDITEKKFLMFIEKYYQDEMHHIIIESMINCDEITEEIIKAVNEKLGANKILQDTFKGIKFDGKNKEEILEKIDKNRLDIISNTFKNKKKLYRNYCNTNCLFSDEQTTCRLLGYSIDTGKKGKSISYNFDNNKMDTTDTKYFDFIPLAFTEIMKVFLLMIILI